MSVLPLFNHVAPLESDSPSHHYPRHSASSQARRLNKKNRLATKRQTSQIQPDPYTPFFVPEELLHGSTRQFSQSQSPLSTLPNELILLIVEHLSIPYFQVSFGLTCKKLSSILAQNRMRLSKWRGYCDKDGLYRLLVQPERVLDVFKRPTSRQKQGVRGAQDVLSISHPPSLTCPSPPLQFNPPSSSYIPNHLRLCRACFRHVPRDLAYWQPIMRDKQYDAPGVNWHDIMNFFEESSRNCGQHKCPDCCVNGYMAFMSGARYEAALKEDIMEEGFGLDLDGDEGGRRVCPQLLRRLGRP